MSAPLRLATPLLLAAVVAWLALAAASAAAATITVNSLADTTGGAECTLRDAIVAANSDSWQGGCPAGAGSDTILFGVSGTIGLVSSALPHVPDGSTVTIDGAGHSVTISGSNAVPVLSVSGVLTLRDLTIANGHNSNLSFEDGGGVAVRLGGSLSVTHCTLSNNFARRGGGAISSVGALDIRDSTFSGNSTFDEGGAAVGSFGGVARISGSTFVGNHTALFGAVIETAASFDIQNSTFSGNTANRGSVIGTRGAGSISNTTIVGNTALGLSAVGGTTLLSNTVIAGNSGGDCIDFGDLTQAGPNLIGDGSCQLAGALTGNPMLGSLADNGGPTLTHALLPGSPAIDAGDGRICATLPTDQRGAPRSVDGNRDGSAVCDLGAYEYARRYDFSGFLGPVDNLPTVNAIKAGRAVPVTFGLGGDQGLGIFAAASPSSQRITCDSNAPLSDVDLTTTTGGSALTYDPATDTYTYVWKTDKAWAGTCRQLVVQLVDGTFHLASFRMK